MKPKQPDMRTHIDSTPNAYYLNWSSVLFKTAEDPPILNTLEVINITTWIFLYANLHIRVRYVVLTEGIHNT